MRKYIIVVVMLIMLTPIMLWLFYPIFPKQWESVKIGMNEKQVFSCISGTYSSPSGLEQEGARLDSNEYYFGLGYWMYIAGNEYTLIVTYDKNGRDGGYDRKVVKTKIIKDRIPFGKFIMRLSEMFL